MAEIKRDATDNPLLDQSDRFLNYSFHELRTPLTVIYSCAQLAFDKLPSNPDFDRLRRVMKQMLNQSEEMVEMLDEFLEASRLQAGKLQLDVTEIDMRELYQQTLAHLSEANQQRVTLKLPDGEERLTLQADGTRLETAIFALLDLGLKVASSTTISLELEKHESGAFIINVVIPDLKVSDDEASQMFEPNFIPDNTYSQLKAGRSGVGLYIAQGLIKAHGGTLRYVPEQPGFQIKLDSSSLEPA